MDTSDLQTIGRALADRHAHAAEPDPAATLSSYAERPRVGDWSMRAALTRFAQPQALRSSLVMRLVRRLDAVLQPMARPLQRHTVTCDRMLSIEMLAGPPIEPYADTRVADLARIERSDAAGFDSVLAGYEAAAVDPLDDAERASLPLLGVALHLDALAEALADWANRGPQNPPVVQVDAACERVLALLDELGVPEEEGPRPSQRGRRDRSV